MVRYYFTGSRAGFLDETALAFERRRRRRRRSLKLTDLLSNLLYPSRLCSFAYKGNGVFRCFMKEVRRLRSGVKTAANETVLGVMTVVNQTRP